METRKSLGVHDVPTVVQTTMKLDPQGFKIAETEDGKIIGTVAVTSIGDDENGIYFGGIFFVNPKFRGYGVGVNLFKCCYEMSRHANLVANSVPELMGFYKDAGFSVFENEWTIVKNQTSSNVFPEVLSNVLPPRVDIQPFEDSFLQSMFAYDYDLIGYKRSIALEMSCKEKDSKTFVAFKNGKCVGFGSIKKSCLGAGRVGPLFADDPAVAEVLLRKLLEAFPERKGFAMMTISSNVHANNLVKKLSCSATGICYRMHTKERLITDTSRIFAQSDLNFSPF
ncbi:n-acetyltransferase domain-containing protein [Trichonephila inaurata madagascariensis]|uniref:N-acetyltransferase domain-containing protein n=1 Tax=Trichonephila inaurata madagascariensis TaxID=2747483 RepID=A0A8X6MDP6_9ARAC|nr:n-acetyltransferase domain-containing protein [Trichonephila inaurata madagascariensis]